MLTQPAIRNALSPADSLFIQWLANELVRANTEDIGQQEAATLDTDRALAMAASTITTDHTVQLVCEVRLL